MDKLYEVRSKAIRKYCTEVCNLSPKEVRLCTCYHCPLYAYRMGTNPSPETLEKLEEYNKQKTQDEEDN